MMNKKEMENAKECTLSRTTTWVDFFSYIEKKYGVEINRYDEQLYEFMYICDGQAASVFVPDDFSMIIYDSFDEIALELGCVKLSDGWWYLFAHLRKVYCPELDFHDTGLYRRVLEHNRLVWDTRVYDRELNLMLAGDDADGGFGNYSQCRRSLIAQAMNE